MAVPSPSSARPTPLDLLDVVRRAARPILLTTLAAALVSAVIALRLPNLYPATATFYTTNLEASDPDQLAAGERRVVLLPKPEDLDRAVNIGRSQPVADFIIKKYRLAAHYDYDTATTAEALQTVREKFNERLAIEVTDRDAVELTFIDADRELAATIANDLVGRIDSVSVQLMHPNRERVLALFENRYRALAEAFEVTRDSLLINRRRFGIPGMYQESRYLARELIRKQAELTETRTRLNAQRAAGQATGTLPAQVAGLEAAVTGLVHQVPGGQALSRDAWIVGNPVVERLQAEMDGLQTELVKARSAYEAARASLTSRVSNVYVVQPAFPVARKVRPIRWLIVAASTLGAFILTSLAALLLEAWRRQLGDPDSPADAWPTDGEAAARRPVWQRVRQ